MVAATSEPGFPRTEIRKELVDLLGSDRVLHTPEELLVYECDGLTLHSRMPDFVVFPNSTQEVLQVVRLACRHETPFLARGAGTSLSGGTIAAEGGIVLELSRMNRILQVDLENRLAQVQPGVVNQHVTRAVEADDFYYAPDPSSQVASTIGGNVAENAGEPDTLENGGATNHVRETGAVLRGGEGYGLEPAAGWAVGSAVVRTFVGSG